MPRTPGMLTNLRRAVSLVWESAPGLTVATVVLLVIQGVLPLLTLYMMKLLVDAVTAGALNPAKGEVFHRLVTLAVFWGVVMLVSSLTDAVSGVAAAEHDYAVTNHVQDLLQRKAIELDLEYYENADYHDTLHRAQSEASSRPSAVVRSLSAVLQSGVGLGGTVVLLVALNWQLTAVVFAAAVPAAFIRKRLARESYDRERALTQTARHSEYYHYLITLQHFAKELRLFALGDLFIGRSRELRARLRATRREMEIRRAVKTAAGSLFALIPALAAFGFIARQVVAGVLNLGSLVLLFQALQRGQVLISAFLGSLGSLYQNNLFLTNLHDFLDLEPKIAEPAEPRPVQRPMEQGIVLDRVSFQYASSTRKALNDVSLAIRPGEVVALVGDNGCGKSTLVKLLCRLYDPDSGSISIDGTDLRLFSPAELRRQLSVVFQDYVTYELTARENIWLGNVELEPDDPRVLTAARDSGADRVIAGLPQGSETFLGTWLEKGEQLSVGQWQKIALARAFLRDAQVMILDEPTSALDPIAEYEVFEKFRQLVRGRTAILISHRLSTVRMADRIFVMKDGRILESGTHDELVRRGEAYAELFETQARAYR